MRPLLLLFMLSFALAAQEKKPPAKTPAPVVLFARPLVVEPGKKTKVLVRGRHLEGVSEVRVHEPKSRGVVSGKAKTVGLPANYPPERFGDSEITIELDVSAAAPGGTLAFSVVGPGGESAAAKVALADETPRCAEQEPNDGLDKPQALALPGAVDAAIDRERDTDVFSFTGKAGERYRIEIQAARLGSPADLMISVLDAERRILDTCDDVDGSTDPRLDVTLPRDGTYRITVLEANDLGGAMFPYRLIVRPR